MAKAYRCADCKIVRAVKWTGRCPNCGGFFNIQITNMDGDGARPEPVKAGQVVTLDDVASAPQERISTGVEGFDRILGKDPLQGNFGIAQKAGHAIQIYGEPGAGKSTLLSQACLGLIKQRFKVLYIAGEESLEQIKARFARLGKHNAKLVLVKETDLDAILDIIDEEEPDIVIIDSINMVEVDEYEIGSTNAIKIATKDFVKLANRNPFGLLIVVQINKASNDFAGPKALEHMVDTSLFLRNSTGKYRVLECKTKNRHGDTPAYAHFLMTEKGLIGDDKSEDSAEAESDNGSGVVEKKKPRKRPGKPTLKSVPMPPDSSSDELDNGSESPSGIHTVSTEIVLPKDAARILTFVCDKCLAPVGKACTADNGAREVGFHQSRMTKARTSPTTPPPTKPKRVKKKKPPELTT